MQLLSNIQVIPTAIRAACKNDIYILNQVDQFYNGLTSFETGGRFKTGQDLNRVVTYNYTYIYCCLAQLAKQATTQIVNNDNMTKEQMVQALILLQLITLLIYTRIIKNLKFKW